MWVRALVGSGMNNGWGPEPPPIVIEPICEVAGQLPLAAAAPSQSGIPANLATRPGGRVVSTLAMFCSPSLRVIWTLKGVLAPATGLVLPAFSYGSKPPVLQFSSICTGDSRWTGIGLAQEVTSIWVV